MKQPVLHIYHQEEPGFDVTIAGGREALALLRTALNEILNDPDTSRAEPVHFKTSDGADYRIAIFDAGDIVESKAAALPSASAEAVDDTVRIIWD